MIIPGKPLAQYGITMGEQFLNPQGVPYQVTNLNFDVIILIGKGSTLERDQQKLDQWLGFENDVVDGVPTLSIPMAISQDTTLGGTVDYCESTTVDSYGPIEYNGNQYFGARIHFQVSTQ